MSELVIGLEIHVQLDTETKLFCGCKLSFGEEANTRTCPVCLGHPGTLPALNQKAVELAVTAARGLGCELNSRSVFARKHYFYPDLPKGYQISQYDQPLAGQGKFFGARIERIHMEEDAAKLSHTSASGRLEAAEKSLVDFNRGGTPLIEIVTAPDFTSPQEAVRWLRILQATLRALEVSDANMEEGSLRCDANLSIRNPDGSLGTKTELKNMNSFRFLEKAMSLEAGRHQKVLAAGKPVTQATIHYDPAKHEVRELRSKETAPDYRYLDDPDLPHLVLESELLDTSLPILPAECYLKLKDLGLSEEEAYSLSLKPAWANYLITASGLYPKASRLYPWVIGELPKYLNCPDDLETARFIELIKLLDERLITPGAAKELLRLLVKESGEVREIAERYQLTQNPQGTEEAVRIALMRHPDICEAIRGGNPKGIGVLVGEVMKELKGRGNGQEIKEQILSELKQG